MLLGGGFNMNFLPTPLILHFLHAHSCISFLSPKCLPFDPYASTAHVPGRFFRIHWHLCFCYLLYMADPTPALYVQPVDPPRSNSFYSTPLYAVFTSWSRYPYTSILHCRLFFSIQFRLMTVSESLVVLRTLTQALLAWLHLHYRFRSLQHTFFAYLGCSYGTSDTFPTGVQSSLWHDTQSIAQYTSPSAQ